MIRASHCDLVLANTLDDHWGVVYKAVQPGGFSTQGSTYDVHVAWDPKSWIANSHDDYAHNQVFKHLIYNFDTTLQCITMMPVVLNTNLSMSMYINDRDTCGT